MRLGTKLLFAQLPLGAALVAVGLLAIDTIDTLGANAQGILKDNHRSVLATQRMRDALDELQVTLVNRGEARIASQRFEQELRVQEGNITEEGEGELTVQLRSHWSSLMTLLAKSGDVPELLQAIAATRAAIDRVLVLNQDAMVHKSERAGHVASQRRAVMLAVLVVAVVLGLYASTQLTRRLLSPLTVLTLAAKRLGSGDFAARARVQGHDEISQLAHEFNAMAAHLSEYQSSSLGELLQAQQAAQGAIDSLLDPVIMFAADGRCTGFNDAAEHTLKLHSTGDALASVEPSVRVVVTHVLSHVLAGRGAYAPRGFDEAVAVDGERFLLPRATPIYGRSGAISGATIVLQDVTRLRRFDELKNDLVATVAHEFRTPLTSLRMAVHLCLEEKAGPVTDRQVDLLDAAKQDCQRLQSLVDELLELSRVEGGQANATHDDVSISLLVGEAVDRHERLARERGVRLVAQVSPFLPHVRVDRERFPLVFDNLIVNALRHSGEGQEVTISARIDAERLRVTIADRGPGIAAEFRDRIFDKFFRVPGSVSGGAGLGLYIARQIVRAHGGDLVVESQMGSGSEFTMTLPFSQEPS